MPRYIDEKDVYALVEPSGIAKVHCSQIDELPRADVVPKSEVESIITLNNQLEAKVFEERKEVERLKHILDCYALQYGTVKEQQAVIDKANQEFASEIFAEIDKIRMIERAARKRGIEDCYNSDSEYAELEKKYTEGEDKPASEEKYFSPEDVRKMTNQEVREKYTAIRKSMERWYMQ